MLLGGIAAGVEISIGRDVVLDWHCWHGYGGGAGWQGYGWGETENWRGTGEGSCLVGGVVRIFSFFVRMFVRGYTFGEEVVVEAIFTWKK